MERDRFALRQIVELADEVHRVMGSTEKAPFVDTPGLWAAVGFFILHIGENAGRLSAGLRDRHPTLAWSDLIGMRNILAHAYDYIEPDRLWEAAKKRLPALVAICRAELDAIGD